MRWGIVLVVGCGLSTAAHAGAPVCTDGTSLVQTTLGSPISYCAKADGTRHGEYVRYYTDGRVEAERGTYADGARTGTWVRGEYTFSEYSDDEYYEEHYESLCDDENELDYHSGPEQELGMLPPEALGAASAVASYDDAGESVKWLAYQGDGTLLASWVENKRLGGATGEHPVLHGIVHGFHTDGSKFLEGTYEAGARIGTWVRYNADGSKSQEGTYAGGHMQGPWKRWSPKGHELWSGQYVADKREGAWTFGSWEGDESTTGEYSSDMKVGTWTRTMPARDHAFVPDATKQVAVFREGYEASVTAYYADGTKAAEYGALCIYGALDGCEADGAFKRWHPNGKLAAKGTYERVMEGDCGGYPYKMGKWTLYHDNGKKKAKGSYDWDSENGKWSYWTAKGKKLKTLEYDHGVDVAKKAKEDKERRKVSLAANLEGVEGLTAPTAEAIFTGDVFAYYGLEAEYDTPLKKKHYKKTDGYKAFKKELATLKKGLSKRRASIVFEGVTLGEFDLKTKRFELFMSKNAYGEPIAPKCFLGWCFSKLPIHEVATADKIGKKKVKKRQLYIKAKEAEALNMENVYVDIHLIFAPHKMATQKYLYASGYTWEWKWHSEKQVGTKGLTVIITPMGSDEILWQRSY
jgi:antitoxin component YwqK of YwqJK toxin-antitoxin module